MLYLDTSLLVAALTAEGDGNRVDAWLRSRSSEEFIVSDWVVAEFSAALSIKLRDRRIDQPRRAVALSLFSRFCAETAVVVPIDRQHFRDAARFADQHATGICAGDALHLAVASAHGATLCTLDRRLGDAGPALGVATLLI